MYNYGSYDTIATIAKVDTQIKVEEFKTAKLNYKSKDTLTNMGLVVKTAAVAALYFLKECFTHLGLAIGATFGKLLKIKAEEQFKYKLDLSNKEVNLNLLKVRNNQLSNSFIQAGKSFMEGILS